MKAWLGLGSNLQDPVTQVFSAFTQLSAADGIEVLRFSSLYRTPPWGDERQDDFINAVVHIQTALEPLALLRVLQSIENLMGRQRSDRRWGPRVIDIDILLYGEQLIRSTDLDLPHPRMHERAFVLLPLSELEPALEIPAHGKVSSLLAQLDCSDIYRLCGKDLLHPGVERK